MKRGKKNEWEYLLEEHISDLDKFTIPHNRVLVELDPLATEKTLGGIYVVKDHDFAAHAVRWGKVIKIPKNLYCQVGDTSSMSWECDIDIQEGDEICMIHQDSYYGLPFYYKDVYHRLVDYGGIILARRDGEIIMCNGFILLEKVFEVVRAGVYEKEVEDKRWGVIKAVGKPNRRYKSYDKDYKKEVLKLDSQVGLKVGDKVFIEDISRVFELEDWAHAILDNRKIFKVASRRRLGAVVS